MKNEITLKAFFLSIFLSIILSSAMVYLGLYAGMTISASIPAAIMSMGILRLFKNSNILENNIVQTAASAGESLAAGVIFTLPALLLIGYWDTISYWEVTKIAPFIATAPPNALDQTLKANSPNFTNPPTRAEIPMIFKLC